MPFVKMAFLLIIHIHFCEKCRKKLSFPFETPGKQENQI